MNEIDLVYKIAAELFNNKEKSSVLDKYSNLVNKKEDDVCSYTRAPKSQCKYFKMKKRAKLLNEKAVDDSHIYVHGEIVCVCAIFSSGLQLVQGRNELDIHKKMK